MRRLFKWIGIFFVILLLLLAAPLVYIHVACNSGGVQARPSDQSQLPAAIADALPDPSQWKRPEADSFLTYPEWYIVHTSQDYARYLADHTASGFRYFASAFGFWTSYCQMNRHVTARYPFSRDAHITDYVIGVSHSAEFILRGIYENTIGRLSALFAPAAPTAEERYAQIYWTDYGNFLKTTPWYDYPYAERQRDLWSRVSREGPGQFRKWERRLALSAEFAVKGAYAGVIGGGTKAAFAPVVPTTLGVVERVPESIPSAFRDVKILAQSGDLSLMSFPRYAAFTDVALRMAESSSARFVEIAGNRSVLVTVAGPREVRTDIRGAREIFRTDMLAGNGGSRVGIAVPVEGLLDLIRELRQQGQSVEHIYDY